MGLFDKVKSILFDEEEIEIPEIKKEEKVVVIKKEEIKEEKNPIKEIKIPKEDFSDKGNYKSESTFSFPIDFEDEPKPVVERPKPIQMEKREIKKETRDIRNYSDFLTRKEEKKKFKPTPIISPVYGVLDQNYKKEDVIVKTEVLRRSNDVTLDEVRKKAYGTLEDDLESNLVIENEELKKVEVTKEIPVIEAPVDKMKTIGELIEEEEINVDIPVIDSINDNEVEYNNIDSTDIYEEPKNSIEDLIKEEKNIVQEELNDDIDDEEADLFSLIDSMYEEKGE